MENNTKKVSPGLASQSAKRRTKGKTNKDTVDMEKTWKNEKGDRIKEDTKEQRETDMEKEWKRENPPNYLPIRGQPLKVLSRAITETYWNNAQLEHLCLLILLLLLPFPYPFSFSYFDSFLQVCMNNPVEKLESQVNIINAANPWKSNAFDASSSLSFLFWASTFILSWNGRLQKPHW